MTEIEMLQRRRELVVLSAELVPPAVYAFVALGRSLDGKNTH